MAGASPGQTGFVKPVGYLALAAAAMLCSSCGGSSSSGQPTPAVTTTVTTAAPSGSPTTTATPATGGVGRAINGAGTTLTPPRSPTTKRLAGRDAECYGLLDRGFRFVSCERYHSKLGTAVALVELRHSQERDLVYQLHGASANLALRRVRTAGTDTEDGNPTTSVIQVSDLVNDNTPKAVFEVPEGAADDGTATFGDLDVVEASGVVVLHVDLHGGVARKAFGGGLETYTPAGAGKAMRRIYRYRSGAWRVVEHKAINSDQIPNDTGF